MNYHTFGMTEELRTVSTIRLSDAKLCIDCQVIFNGSQCPYCASREYLLLSRVLNRKDAKPSDENAR